MNELIRHLVTPIVQNPKSVSLQEIEGDNVTVVELVVHADDRDLVDGDKGKTIRSIRNIVSAAAGHRKVSVDLVDAHSEAEAEE
jgi:hypothetical protein